MLRFVRCEQRKRGGLGRNRVRELIGRKLRILLLEACLSLSFSRDISPRQLKIMTPARSHPKFVEQQRKSQSTRVNVGCSVKLLPSFGLISQDGDLSVPRYTTLGNAASLLEGRADQKQGSHEHNGIEYANGRCYSAEGSTITSHDL